MRTKCLSVLLVLCTVLTIVYTAESSARLGGWYRSQSMVRSNQMAQQRRLAQQQRQVRETQRRQQQALRQQRARQQQAMRAQQQRMRQQMQQRQKAVARQRTAMLQRQRNSQRQRQQAIKSRQIARAPKTSRTTGNIQQKANQLQRSLRQQRLAKERTDRLRKLRLQRDKQRNAQTKSKQENTALAFSTLASRTRSLPRTSPKPTTPKNFKENRQLNRTNQQRLTQKFQKQREYVQARANQLKKLSKINKKGKLKPPNRAAHNLKQAASKNFKNCNGNKCTCSFHGDTGVLTSSGVIKISNLQPGIDLVWSKNAFTGDSSWQPILSHYSNQYDAQIHITISSYDSPHAQTVISNEIHPFFVVQSGLRPVSSKNRFLQAGKWKPAKELRIGDSLLASDNSILSVESVSKTQQEFEAFNLHVANSHTYFVTGELSNDRRSVWVHNHCHDSKTNANNKSIKLLNPPIDITAKGLKHTLDRHTINGIAKYSNKSKFNKDVDVKQLIQNSVQQKMVKQKNGYYTRTYDVGRPIGTDRSTNKQTSTITVVTKANGNLVTAHPGKPGIP